MSTQHEVLHQLLDSAVQAAGHELLGFEWLKQGKYTLLRVYVDTPAGVTLEVCTAVSRQINAVLNVEEVIKGDYHLEVSSPGLDRPLFNLKHYERFIGHGVKVKLRQPVGKQKNITGAITSVEGEMICITDDNGKAWPLTLDDITKANLIPEL